MLRVPEDALDYPGHDARYHYQGIRFHGVAYTLHSTGELMSEAV